MTCNLYILKYTNYRYLSISNCGYFSLSEGWVEKLGGERWKREGCTPIIYVWFWLEDRVFHSLIPSKIKIVYTF